MADKSKKPDSTAGWPETGFVRLKSIIGPNNPIPMSKSSLWLAVAEGRFPKPVKLGNRTTVWRVEDLRSYIDAQH